MGDENSNSLVTSSSTPLSSRGSSAVLLECVRIVCTSAAAVILCALGKFPPELAAMVLVGNALPADPTAVVRRLLGGRENGR